MSNLEAIAIVVGMVCGVAGFVLGGISFGHQWLSTKPRIAVRLHDASGLVAPNDPQKRTIIYVDICNVGQMSVVMSPVLDFLPRRGQQKNLMPFLPETPCEILPNEVVLPGELKPQHSAILRFDFGPGDLPEGRKLGRAYVRSVVGDRFKASRPAMKAFAKSRKAAAARLRKAGPATPCTSSPTSQPHGEAPGLAANTASSP